MDARWQDKLTGSSVSLDDVWKQRLIVIAWCEEVGIPNWSVKCFYVIIFVYYIFIIMFVWSDGNARFTGRSVWECADELQRGSGSDNTAADNVARTATHRDVCTDVPQQSSPAPGYLQWEGQSDDTSVVSSVETGTLHQTQTHSDGISSVYVWLVFASISQSISLKIV